MQASLTESALHSCASDLGQFDVPGLQSHAGELRTVIGRLQGRLDQTLAALEELSGGQVRENVGSEHAPLYMATRIGPPIELPGRSS